MPKFRLISFPLRPYVQRATILLADKLQRIEGQLGEGLFQGKPKLSASRAALAERSSLRGAVAETHLSNLRDFVDARGGYLASLTEPALAA